MNIDEKLTQLLRENAPPQHDPMFRLAVLERRERQRFQRGLGKVLIAGLGMFATALVSLGTEAKAAQIGVVLFCVALLVSGFVHAPVVKHFSRKLFDQGQAANSVSA